MSSCYLMSLMKAMGIFADAWPNRAIVQRAAAQIPWSSNLLLLEKIKNPETRLFYAEKTHTHDWSKVILGHQISLSFHEREGNLTSNFATALPPADSDLASQIFKKAYVLAGYRKPIAIAEWEKQLTQSLPNELKSSLPSIEEIEQELEAELAAEESDGQVLKQIRRSFPACGKLVA